MRSLAPDEAELWARVTATIRPLSREPADKPALTSPAAAPRPQSRPAQPAPRPASRTAPTPHRQATLDGSWDRKLRSGSADPDRVLDLHGRNLDQAWRAIDSALEAAIARGERIVLLITGHERPGEPPVRRGRIRAAIDDWLAASRHAAHIAAVRSAHRRHGGGGSLYIILKKSPPRSTFS